MDFFDIEFPELPSIAPDLIFKEEPLPANSTLSHELTTAQRESLMNLILDDHAYAKPYPPSSVKGKMGVNPLKVLKVRQNEPLGQSVFKRNSLKSRSHGSEDEDEIDVVGVDDVKDNEVLSYDHNKAENIMNEVETYLNSLWKNVDKDDDEKIPRASWSKEQGGLFDLVYKLINNYQLAKLAYFKNTNEPVHRRLALDKATKRIRSAFGLVFWNTKLIVWLHGILVDGLGSSLFLCYLEILQSLKRKTPALFERILSSDKTASDKELSLPNLGPRLKKSWDPSVGLKSHVSIEKFPLTPFLIMVPSGPTIPQQSTKRNRFWNAQLSEFSKVCPISVPAYRTFEGYVIKHFLEHCINAVRTKIIELRDRFPDRPIILVGWGVGSLISLKVANLDKIDAVVCLGLPTNGIDGDTNGDYLKGLTQIKCPVLFFVGSHAKTNSIAKTEKLRKQMKTQSSLIVIEGAEELLRLTTSKKKSLGMTQNMLDKLIQDQIYDFLKDVLFKPKPVTSPPPKNQGAVKKRKKKAVASQKEETKRKRKVANIKSPAVVPEEANDNCSLLPLDVSISSHTSTTIGNSQGLLTTGTVYTSVPHTELYNDSATSVTGIIQKASDILLNTVEGGKKIARGEKGKRGRGRKKISNVGHGTKVVPDGVQSPVTGVVDGVVLAGDIQQGLHPVTFQRIPSGSFVLSGASGQVRLQGAANIVYLQQTSNGATQLLSPSTITSTTSNVYTAVVASSPLAQNPPKINIIPSTNFKFGPVTTASNITMNKGGISAVISAGGCGNLVFSPPEESTSMETESTCVTSPLSINTGNADILNVDQTTLPSTTVLPPGSTSTIMTHLSANDIRCLASLIAKHSNSRPSSPSSALSSPNTGTKVDGKSQLDFGENVSDIPASFLMPSTIGDTKSNAHMSPIPGLFDKKLAFTSASQGNKRPPTVVQRVSSLQPKDQLLKIKTPRLKASVPSNVSAIHVTNASSSGKGSNVMHKLPATLTIPISRLQANFNLSSSHARAINVPLLSTCIPHSSSTLARNTSVTTTLTSSSVRQNVGGILLAKADIKSPNKGNSPSPITFTIPQSFKDPKMLKKAVSDVKVVGVLNQQARSQMNTLVNLSALRSISNPSSPQLSPTNLFHSETSSQDNSEKSSVNPRKSSLLTCSIDNSSKMSLTSLASSASLATKVVGSSGKTGTTAFLGKLFSGPRSIVDPTWGKVNAQRNKNQLNVLNSRENDSDGDGDEIGEIDELIDEDDDDENVEDNDVDFAISPASPGEPNFGTVYVNKPVVFNSPKQSNVTKIVYAPAHANEKKKAATAPTNIIDIARAKLRETQFRSPDDASDSLNFDESIAVGDSKLRFEPLKISSSRVKLKSVLSRRDTKPDCSSAMNVLHDSGSSNSIVSKNNTVVVSSPHATAETKLVANISNKASVLTPSCNSGNSGNSCNSICGQESFVQHSQTYVISTTNTVVSAHERKIAIPSSQITFPLPNDPIHPISELKVSTSAQNKFLNTLNSESAHASVGLDKFSSNTSHKRTTRDLGKSHEDLFRSIEKKLPFLRSGDNTQVNTRSRGSNHQNNQITTTRRGRGKRGRSSLQHGDGLEGKKVTRKRRGGMPPVVGVSRTKKNKVLPPEKAKTLQVQGNISLNGGHILTRNVLDPTDVSRIPASAIGGTDVMSNAPSVISADEILQNMCAPEEMISTSSVYDLLSSLQVPSTSFARTEKDIKGAGNDHDRTFGSIDPALIPPLGNIDTTVVNKPVGMIAPMNKDESDASSSISSSELPVKEVTLPLHIEFVPNKTVPNVTTMVNMPILSSVQISNAFCSGEPPPAKDGGARVLSSSRDPPRHLSPPALAVIRSQPTYQERGGVPPLDSSSCASTVGGELQDANRCVNQEKADASMTLNDTLNEQNQNEGSDVNRTGMSEG